MKTMAQLPRGSLAISVGILAAAVTRRVVSGVLLIAGLAIALLAPDYLGNTLRDPLILFLAGMLPEATFRDIAHGVVRTGAIAQIVITVATHVAIALAWLQPGKDRGYRWSATALLALASLVLTA